MCTAAPRTVVEGREGATLASVRVIIALARLTLQTPSLPPTPSSIYTAQHHLQLVSLSFLHPSIHQSLQPPSTSIMTRTEVSWAQEDRRGCGVWSCDVVLEGIVADAILSSIVSLPPRILWHVSSFYNLVQLPLTGLTMSPSITQHRPMTSTCAFCPPIDAYSPAPTPALVPSLRS